MAIHRFTREEIIAAPPPFFRWRYRVRIQDVDAAGIVFFARYLEIFHDGLFAFLADAGVDLVALLSPEAPLAPVKHAELDYFRPLRFGDEVELGPVIARLETTQASVGYRMMEVSSGELVALAQIAHVAVTPRSFERTEMPEALREAFSRL